MLELLYIFTLTTEIIRPSTLNINKKYNVDQSKVKIILTEMNPNRMSLCRFSHRDQIATLKINEFKFNELTEQKQKEFVVAQTESCKKQCNM
jgi:hypothetical protein